MTLRLVEETAKRLNEEQTKQLLDEVKAWEKADEGFFQKMLEAQKIMKGDQWPSSSGKMAEHRVTANLAFAMFKSSLPYIFFKEPTARCRPRTPLQVGKEVVWDGIYNGAMPIIDYAKQKRLQIEDAWTYSEGWSKWVISPARGPVQAGATTRLSEVPRGPAKWHGKGLPVSLRVTPRQVIVDSEAVGRDPDLARAIFIKYRVPLSEALLKYKIDEKKYRRALDKKHEGAKGGEFQQVIRARLDDFFGVDQGSIPKNESYEEMVTIYEGWVYQLVDYKLFQQVVVLLEDYPLPVMQPKPWSAFVGEDFPGWPIRKMEFNRIPDSLPENNVQITKNLQQVFNWLLSKLVNHVDSLNTVRTVNSNGVQNMKKTMRQLRRGKSLEYVEITEPDAIQNVSTPPYPGDAYNLLGIVEGLIDRIGPGSRNRTGQLDARTATEANIVEQSLRTLDDDTVDVVRKFLVEDLEQMGHILLQVLDRDQILKLAGDTGSIEFGIPDDDTLSSLPDVDIEVDSFRKVSIQEKMQPWTVIWGLAVQAAQMGMINTRLDVILGRISLALGIDPGVFMGNLEDERIAELFDIINSIQAAEEGLNPLEAVPLPEDANPIVRLQVDEFFLNSETAKRMGQGAISAVEQRRLHLMELADAMQDRLTTSPSAGAQANLGQNPFDQQRIQGGNGTNAPDAATRARSQTQQDLQAGGLQPGTRGTPG